MNSSSRSIDPKELMSVVDSGEAVVVIDVRRKDDYNAVLDHLLARNVKACYIQGGITAWKEQGGPLIKKRNT